MVTRIGDTGRAAGRRCVICAAGPAEEPRKLAGYLRPDDYIIAADGGQWLAEAMGRTPDYIVGDFDSRRPARETPGVPVRRLPVEKDDTDAMAAARLAAERGFRRFLLLGAGGGRLDHTLANLAVMAWLTDYGDADMADERGWTALRRPGRYAVTPREGAVLSLLPYGGPVTAVYARQVGYPLENAVLTPDFPLGISNTFLPRNNADGGDGGAADGGGEGTGLMAAEVSFGTGLLLFFIIKD